MVHRLKQIAFAALLFSFVTAVFPALMKAAAPDGDGPWADEVVSAVQGLRKDGSAVPAARSDASSMLGVAEQTLAEGTFYSLGFGGVATLKFDNGIADAVLVVESTNTGYPVEHATVEVSEDGVTYYNIGTADQTETLAVPVDSLCIQYVRLTDTSVPADFSDDTADGFDVDGVRAIGRACTNDGKMTGGGSFFVAGKRVTHGMQLNCDGSKSNLQINWGKGDKFHLENLIDVICLDNPAIDEGSPDAGFDTFTGHGTGKYNGTDGYHIRFYFTDAGEPGTADQGWLQIRNPADTATILDVPLTYLDKGNHQAH